MLINVSASPSLQESHLKAKNLLQLSPTYTAVTVGGKGEQNHEAGRQRVTGMKVG